MKEVALIVLMASIILGMIGGYVTNAIKFVSCDFEAPYKAEVIHGIGVFVPPVGIIAGYADLGE